MAYTFDAIQAFDSTNPQRVAANANVTIHAVGDAAMTPLPIMDTTGVPLANPYRTNDIGAMPSFVADVERVAWNGGGLSGTLTSWEGLRGAAQAAADAAGLAATNAIGAVTGELSAYASSFSATEASVVVARDAAVSAAADAAASAALAAAPSGAAIAAAIAEGGAARTEFLAAIDARIRELGGGTSIVADPQNPGYFLVGESVPPGGGTGDTTGLPAAPSGGSGGLKTDRTAVPFTGASRTSSYHIYGSNIAAATGPVGMVIHLHGDGAEENATPTGGTLAAYNQVAKSKGYLFVAPLSPDSSGTKTWWENTYSTNWLVALMNDLYAKYNIDKNRVWFTGYSGGAEAISYYMMSDKSNVWNAGGAILLAGGGADGLVNPNPAWTQFMKDNMEMHWVVGENDTPAKGGDDGGFDALAAAIGGEAYHRSRGIKNTSLTVLPGLNHYQAETKGPEHLALHLK